LLTTKKESLPQLGPLAVNPALLALSRCMINRPDQFLDLVDVLLILIKIAFKPYHLLLHVADEVVLAFEVLLNHYLFYLVVKGTVTDRLLIKLF